MGVYVSADLIYGIDLGEAQNWDSYDEAPLTGAKILDFLRTHNHVPKFCGEYDESTEYRDLMEALLDYLQYQEKLTLEFYGEDEYTFPVVGVRRSDLGEHWQAHPLSAEDFPEVVGEDRARLVELKNDLGLTLDPQWYLCITRG